ncbi:hypothetical protein LR48_Vigan475s000400 [Vigna angularis]|uniref:Uncharacterized protein n=1 Tax=Phaseolus angularis TaxID=3914 RepID=A0A0L9TBS5_PHAAN|nr:hypothetical protein LR48_Vigan475s000400 [Vigna angularis]
MASSSGKRLKTMATKRKEKEPEQPHSSRFLSRKHEKHFKVVQDRRLLMERKAGMIPNFAPQFGEQLLGNDWGKLATTTPSANFGGVVTSVQDSLKEVFKNSAELPLRGKLPLSGTLPDLSFCLVASWNMVLVALRGMASSSGKRLKTMATKRKEKEPEQPHSSRFLSRKHEKHFKVVQDRRLLMERKAGMIPNFAPQFGEQLLGNDWGKLATYPAPANIAVVKEFYTNAKKIGDYPAENYLGYVRGHAIRIEIPNDWSAEKSTRNQKSQPVNQKSQPVNQKSQPVNQNAEKPTRTQKTCDRVALSGKIPLSGTFQVQKSPLRGKTSSWGQNGSCGITAQRLFSAHTPTYFSKVFYNFFLTPLEKIFLSLTCSLVFHLSLGLGESIIDGAKFFKALE